jgi:hypothetical protein
VAVAALVRVAWCVVVARPPVGLHDPFFYRLFASQFASGNGYVLLDGSPTAYYPVGYPLLLGAAFLVTPDSWQTGVVAAVNIACQVLAVALVFAITRRLVGYRSVPALVAAGVVALWPNLIYNSAVALTESFFIALLLGSVFAVVGGPWDGTAPSRSRLVTSGVLLGAATLVRPVSLPFLVVYAVAWLVAGVGWRRVLLSTVIVAGAVVLVLLPWVIRNAVVMDAALLSTNTGDNLCMSRRVGGTGAFELSNDRCNVAFEHLERPEYEIARDDHGRTLAIEFIRDHPTEELRLWFRRIHQTLRVDDDGIAAAESYGEDVFLGRGTHRLLTTAANAWYVIVGGVGLVGLGLLLVERRPAGLVVALAPPALLLSVVAFFGDPRFKVPALPFVAIGAGIVADRVLARRTSRSATSPRGTPAPR